MIQKKKCVYMGMYGWVCKAIHNSVCGVCVCVYVCVLALHTSVETENNAINVLNLNKQRCWIKSVVYAVFHIFLTLL